MPRASAGLLVYRKRPHGLQVLLVHPGGPFWARRDEGAWSIPKGEIETGEPSLAAAQREAAEELGTSLTGEFVALAPVRQRGGKVVAAWAVEADWDPARLKSNTFRLEWPRGSGRTRDFPEVDRAAWFSLEEARIKLLPGQLSLLDQLTALIESS